MNKEYLIALYEYTLDYWNKNPLMRNGISFINNKLFRHQKDGSLIIIPSDGSYVQIINKSWYE